LARSSFVVGGATDSYASFAVAEVLVLATFAAVATFAYARQERSSPRPGDVVIPLLMAVGIALFAAFLVEMILVVVIDARFT
jgi:hypothetical protein